MKAVRIAVECSLEHRAAIYTAISSMVQNKSKETEYNVFLMVNTEEEKRAFESIFVLAGENISFEFLEGGIEKQKNTGKLILLSWNVLVQGDLSVLFNCDLEGKSAAMAVNIPDKDCYFSNESEFDDAVVLIDTDKSTETCRLNGNDIIELPAFYNLGFEEILTRKNDIAFNRSEELYTECADSEELALILRFDKDFSPEFFFDTRMESLWMKNYMQSPIKGEVLERKSSVDNTGNIPAFNTQNIPVLIRVNDETTANVVGLIDSIKKNNSSNRKYDIRLIYSNLSKSNMNILSDEKDECISIVLHCIKTDMPDEQIAAAVFSGYDKAICIYSKALVKCNLGDVYDIDPAGNYICAMADAKGRMKEMYVGKYSEIFLNMRFFDTGLTLFNIKDWIMDDLGTQIRKAGRNYQLNPATFHEILNILCLKKRQFLPDDIKILFDYTESEEYEEQLDSYISGNKNADRLNKYRADILLTEDEEMKETLKRLESVEKENESLRQANEQLRCENDRLSGEAGQFLYELLETRKSFTYKIGRVITYIPRMIRSGGSN